MVPEIVRLERPAVCGCGELVAAGERAGYAASHESIVCLDCLADLSAGTEPVDSVDAKLRQPTPDRVDLVSVEWTRRQAAVAATLNALRAGSAMTQATTSGALTPPTAWSAPIPPSTPAPSTPAPSTPAPSTPAPSSAPSSAPTSATALTALPPKAPAPALGLPTTALVSAAAPAGVGLGTALAEPVQSAETAPAGPAVGVGAEPRARQSRHGAVTIRDEHMPALAHRRRAGLFTRLLTVRSIRQSGQHLAAGKPDAAVAALLDAAVARGVLSLHDRHIPGRRGRIEHIAVGASGVYVIDVKHFKNASIELRHTADTPADAGDLVVGGRVMTAALEANRARVAQLRAILTDAGLDDVPVTGALCFVDGLLPLSVGDLEMSGVHIMRPSGLTALVASGGALDMDDREKLQQFLAHHLPACA